MFRIPRGSGLVISAEFDVVFINLLGAKKPFIQSQKHICLFVNLTDKASILVIQSLNDPFLRTVCWTYSASTEVLYTPVHLVIVDLSILKSTNKVVFVCLLGKQMARLIG